MPVAKIKEESTDKRPTKTAGMFADEAFWAGMLGAYQGTGVAKVVSPMIREPLRKALKDIGVDPDDAWEEYQARHRGRP